MKLLADTSALLALLLRDDRNHARAKTFYRHNPASRYVLSDLILAELVTRTRARADASRAAAVGRELLGSSRFQVVFVEPETLAGALDRLEKLADKRLSLTDCSSFELMERLGLEAAFAFDTDFRDCGFRMVP